MTNLTHSQLFVGKNCIFNFIISEIYKDFSNVKKLETLEVLKELGIERDKISDHKGNLLATGIPIPNTNFSIVSSSGRLGQKIGETGLEGITENVIKYIKLFEKKINKNRIDKVKFVISGGTEAGHSKGKFSHSNGWKIDIIQTPELNEYIRTNFQQTCIRNNQNRGQAEIGYIDPTSNTIWWQEKTHWDVQVMP